MSMRGKILKSLKIFVLIISQVLTILISGCVLFMIYVMIGMIVPYQKEQLEEGEFQTVYVRSNGMHTDICFPIENDFYNWWSFFDKADFPDEHYRWVAIGWGDREFYRKTKTWDDFSLSTTLSALFAPTASAMHVEMLTYEPTVSENCEQLKLYPKGYIELAAYVGGSFKLKKWQPDLIPGVTYFNCDRFYEAKQKYHMFNSCNSWTNKGLKIAGVRTASWAVLPETILSYAR